MLQMGLQPPLASPGRDISRPMCRQEVGTDLLSVRQDILIGVPFVLKGLDPGLGAGQRQWASSRMQHTARSTQLEQLAACRMQCTACSKKHAAPESYTGTRIIEIRQPPFSCPAQMAAAAPADTAFLFLEMLEECTRHSITCHLGEVHQAGNDSKQGPEDKKWSH